MKKIKVCQRCGRLKMKFTHRCPTTNEYSDLWGCSECDNYCDLCKNHTRKPPPSADGRILLPYGIEIVGEKDGAWSINSELMEQIASDPNSPMNEDVAIVDAIESLLLAMASQGVMISTEGARQAIEVAVESIVNHID